MNKAKIISSSILLTTFIIIVVLICSRINFSSDHHLDDIQKKQNQNSEVTSTANITSSKSSIEALVSKQTEVKKSVNISEGVLIKKYPGNFASFKFETPDGVKIITDPYQMDETVEPDIVTESHHDGDHVDVSHLIGNYRLIKTPGDYTVKGIKITGILGKHNKGMAPNTNCIYVFEINGIKIAHFASQGELPAEDTLKRIGKVDVLLIQASFKPQYANSKLNVKECAAIIKILDPRIIIPEHGAIKMGKVIADELGIKIEYLNKGELAVTRNGLDALKTMEVNNLDTGELY